MNNITHTNKNQTWNRFWQLAIANIISYIVIPLAGAISVAFLGHMKDISHLAGVTLATVLFDYIYGLLGFLRMGTTGVTAQAVGRNDQEEILLIGLRNGLIAAVIGLLLLVLQYPLRELVFTIFNATPEIKASAIAYFNIRIWGFPAALLNMILIGWLLGQEQIKKVIVISVSGNAANVILNYLFIFQLGWGSTGAGISQASSDCFMLLICLILVKRDLSLKDVLTVSKQILDKAGLIASFSLNGNLFVRSLCVMSIYPIFTNISVRMGENILAQNALFIQIFLICAFFCDGLGLATETLAGNFKGQENQDQLKYLLKISVGSGFSVALIFSGISILFPETVFGLLTDHSELIDQTKIYAPWLLSFLIFTSVSFLLDGYFAALAAGKIIRNASIIGIILGFSPFAVLALHELNNHILWLGMSMFMLIRMVILLVKLPSTLEPSDLLGSITKTPLCE